MAKKFSNKTYTCKVFRLSSGRRPALNKLVHLLRTAYSTVMTHFSSVHHILLFSRFDRSSPSQSTTYLFGKFASSVHILYLFLRMPLFPPSNILILFSIPFSAFSGH